MTTTTPTNPAMPRSVARAVWLMYAGAVLTVLAGIFIILIAPPVGVYRVYGRPPILESHTRQVVRTALVGAIQATTWLWMAWKNKSGRSWARVLSTVIFVSNACVTIPSTLTSGGPVAVVPFQVALWLVALAAVIQLWLPQSEPFYRRRRVAAQPPAPEPAGPGRAGTAP